MDTYLLQGLAAARIEDLADSRRVRRIRRQARR